jgi:hypothetical protein
VLLLQWEFTLKERIMADLLCPVCTASNRSNSRYCRRCGSDLFHDVTVVPSRPSSLQKVSRALPAKQAKQIGQAVAVSVAALALEAGISWMRKRMREQPITLPTVPENKTEVVRPNQRTITKREGSTMMRHRTTQFWRNGELSHEIVENEQIVWSDD